MLQLGVPPQRVIESAGLTDRGCVRKNNEDYFGLLPDAGVYALADGMGGAAAGELASRMAVEAVLEVAGASDRRDSQVLLVAVEEANRRVLAAARGDPRLKGMGTTLVAGIWTGAELLVASIGDSRAYLLDGAGLLQVTEDQSWINEVGRPLGLTEEALRQHPMRNVLTVAVGGAEAIRVDYHAVAFPPGAMALFSSDGLHGVVSAETMEALLRNGSAGEPLDVICRRLVEAANQAGGPDNVTVLLLRHAA